MGNASRAPRAGDCVAEKYLLLRVLDIGGMGAVWVAHHLVLDVQVALKFILPEADSPNAAARLLQEAQVAARVDHPAIVQVFDVGRTSDGDAYLAMELLDGEALAEVLSRERRLDPATAIQVLLPIADALEAIHRRGVIHRDIKPENIFLARDDAGHWQPKLIDFGLARRTDPDAARLTDCGAVMGTPVYMSRERLMGEDVDLQEDLWGLSVVLYLAITGELPFDGKNPIVLIHALTMNRPRSLLSHGVGDADLWAILERGLAPRGERWASARDLGKALAGWLWQHGRLDDISGVSLRQTWIDEDDARRLAGPVPSRVPTVRLAVATPARQTSVPAISEPRRVSTGATADGPRPRALAALGMGLVAAGGLSWARPLPDGVRPAMAPAEVERAPSVATASIVPVLGSTAAPVVTWAPRAAATSSPPPRARSPGIVRRRAPTAEAPAEVPAPLKNPYR